MATKILIVEDELKVASFIQKGLGEYGFETLVALNLAIAQQQLRTQNPDVILLDVNLPDGNGIEFCRQVRADNPVTGIIMLTARGTNDDKLEGFDAGADDYLPKPFEFSELVARIRSLLRRGSAGSATVLTLADLEVNLSTRVVKRAGKPVDLTVKEFNLLEYLLKNKGHVLDRTTIYDRLWDANYETSTNTVDIYIHFLRKKIDAGATVKLIHTIKGIGYVIKEE